MIDRKKLSDKDQYSFEDLCLIMNLLCSEDGCPWDKVQTHESIRNNLIEEAYEAAEGIDKNDKDILVEELGDILLQVVFHSQIAENNSEFDINDVINAICKKLVFRHPHIFSDEKTDGAQAVLDVWEAAKMKEKQQVSLYDTLRSVSTSLPSLMRYQKLLRKCKKAEEPYIDYDDSCETVKSFDAHRGQDKEYLSSLLSSIVNIISENGFDAEELLYTECEKLIKDKENKNE